MYDILALGSILFGIFFFLAGSIGLVRLPDLFSRLHTLAKADNVGLALVALGVILLEADPLNGFKVFIIWVLVMAASSVSSYLVANAALQDKKP